MVGWVRIAGARLMTKKTWRRIGYGAIAGSALAAAAFAAIFQDGIVRFLATPRTPFQTIEPPPAPDYATPAAWLLRPNESAGLKPADVFYVHSTAFYRRKGWNAPIDDANADHVRRVIAAPNEAGPFSAIAEIWAPRYREATLFSQFTHKYDGLAARELAYSDVRRAFQQFVAERDPARPLILVGYGQGALHVQGLLRDHFQGEINPLRRRLVAAYAIGASASAEFLDGLSPAMPVCGAPDRVRCVISYVDFEERFDEEMERVRDRTLVWGEDGRLASSKTDALVCVNPLSWSADATYQPAEKNVGAASATGIAPGTAPAGIARAVGARCDRGILLVDTPKRRILRRGDWFGAKWRAQPFNLFYHDIAQNAAIRLAALEAILKVEPEPLEPISEAIDLGESPVNKVPQ
jgi:hypothetical protein